MLTVLESIPEPPETERVRSIASESAISECGGAEERERERRAVFKGRTKAFVPLKTAFLIVLVVSEMDDEIDFEDARECNEADDARVVDLGGIFSLIVGVVNIDKFPLLSSVSLYIYLLETTGSHRSMEISLTRYIAYRVCGAALQYFLACSL